MAEGVLGVFPASEIWGLDRRRPCTVVLSDRRLLVLRHGPREARALRTRLEVEGLAPAEGAAAYALPLEDVRWVQVYPSLLGDLVKVGTAGGSYRFRLRRRYTRRLEDRLRAILGDGRVRRPHE